jgi:hypothetical protein
MKELIRDYFVAPASILLEVSLKPEMQFFKAETLLGLMTRGTLICTNLYGDCISFFSLNS